MPSRRCAMPRWIQSRRMTSTRRDATSPTRVTQPGAGAFPVRVKASPCSATVTRRWCSPASRISTRSVRSSSPVARAALPFCSWNPSRIDSVRSAVVRHNWHMRPFVPTQASVQCCWSHAVRRTSPVLASVSIRSGPWFPSPCGARAATVWRSRAPSMPGSNDPFSRSLTPASA